MSKIVYYHNLAIHQTEPSPSLHAVSQITERYESAEFLAAGGMKQVFKVYDARCKRDVAMATLHDEAPLELCDPLIHEAWLTAQLDHPNIITIHDVGVDSRNRPYFTMDLKSGDSLSKLIEKLRTGNAAASERYSLENLLQMFVKVCDAISYAHSIQVMHLDLKPANIQVGEYGEVLVCDWGLGRMRKQESGIELERLLLNSDLLSSNTLFGEVRGTPGYMAPEQMDQDGNRDMRTDIYQLGCILYSLLTLQRPLEGDPKDALDKRSLGDIAPPRQRAPDRNIPARLEAVVLKAMSIDPQNRYQTVESLSEEVRRYLTGFATEAEQAGVFTQLSLLYRRNKRLCLTALCSGLVLIYGAAWSYWSLAAKEHLASTAQRKAERTLALYEAGKDEVEKLSAQNAESIERAVVELHLAGNQKRPERLLLMALEDEPTNPVLLRAMGEHYFIMQRFNDAVPLLKRGEKREQWPDQLICDLAIEYANLKPNDNDQLSKDQMINLLRQIENFDGFEAMIVVNDWKSRPGPNQRSAIIEEHLRSINPKWRDGWFEYDFENSRLRLGGKGLERLSHSGSILAGLQPRQLDISDSDVQNLWKETGYMINKLDIRGCPIKGADAGVLSRFVHLKELTISPDQIDLKEVVPSWVNVIIKEANTELKK